MDNDRTGPQLERGIIQIYCGDGKGKTTAAIGQAVRALGQGLGVYMAQFLKPMAVSIAFGLSFATMLTLVLVPCLFLIGNDVRRCRRWLISGHWPRPEEIIPATELQEPLPEDLWESGGRLMWAVSKTIQALEFLMVLKSLRKKTWKLMPSGSKTLMDSL